MNLTIGITGLIGAGKDTFARELQLALLNQGIESRIDSFAAPIREMAAQCYFKLDRDHKERIVWYGRERLEDLIFDAGERVLSPVLMDEILAVVHGRVLEGLEDYIDGDDYAISPRQFMRLVGEVGRAVDPDLWVNLLKQRNPSGVCIVPDVRRLNEKVDLLVGITRPGVTQQGHHTEEFAAAVCGGYPYVAYGAKHEGEVHHVINAANVAYLAMQAEALAKHIVARGKLPNAT